MRISKARKPKILTLKKEVALLVKDKCKAITFDKHPTGRYYWGGTFKFEDKEIRIFWQNYVQGWKYGQANYVNIFYSSSYNAPQIRKKELLRIKEVLLNQI